MSIKQSMAEYVRKHGRDYHTDVAEVYDFEEDVESDGYCETCYYEWTVVRIQYRTSTGEEKVYVYQGDMGEFIRALTDEE